MAQEEYECLAAKEGKAEAHLSGLVGRGQDKEEIPRRKNMIARSWNWRHGELRHLHANTDIQRGLLIPI